MRSRYLRRAATCTKEAPRAYSEDDSCSPRASPKPARWERQRRAPLGVPLRRCERRWTAATATRRHTTAMLLERAVRCWRTRPLRRHFGRCSPRAHIGRRSGTGPVRRAAVPMGGRSALRPGAMRGRPSAATWGRFFWGRFLWGRHMGSMCWESQRWPPQRYTQGNCCRTVPLAAGKGEGGAARASGSGAPPNRWRTRRPWPCPSGPAGRDRPPAAQGTRVLGGRCVCP